MKPATAATSAAKTLAGALSLTLGLAIVGPASPAHSAAPTTSVGLRVEQNLANAGTCGRTFSTKDPGQVDMPIAGGTRTAEGSSVGTVIANGATVANAQSAVSTRASFATVAGGLSSFALTSSVRAAFARRTSGSCGANGLMATMSARSTWAAVRLPTRGAGWLTITATGGRNTGAQVSYIVAVARAGDTSTGSVAAAVSVAPGTRTSRVYLPAGSRVTLQVHTEAKATLRYDSAGQPSASAALAISGSFAPAGVALTPERGAALARRAVALPNAVSCAGSARIGLTKVARKRAKSAVIRVNGRVVKRVAKIKRARAYAVRVPTAGGITVAVQVKPKQGRKTVKVTRTYAACR